MDGSVCRRVQIETEYNYLVRITTYRKTQANSCKHCRKNVFLKYISNVLLQDCILCLMFKYFIVVVTTFDSNTQKHKAHCREKYQRRAYLLWRKHLATGPYREFVHHQHVYLSLKFWLRSKTTARSCSQCPWLTRQNEQFSWLTSERWLHSCLY